MGAEDHTGEHSFDELARGLVTGSVSRRKALRLMGAALLGGALASIPGVALAAPCPSGQTLCPERGVRPFCCEGVCCKGGGGPGFCCPAQSPQCCKARGQTACCDTGTICCLTPDGLTCTDTVTTCEQLLGGEVIS
jgi:hypothetical protein